MKNQTITTAVLLSQKTVEKLEAALSKGNREKLKKDMEKLFTFKKIFNLHDDHLVELAECIIDLANADDRVEYACFVEKYVKERISRYQKRKKKLSDENQWAQAAKNMDELTMMDLKYQLWVYECGFEYSHFCMYTMLCHITQDIQKSAGDDKK